MNIKKITEQRKVQQDIYSLFWKRFSSRTFSKEVLKKEEVLKLIEAARWAPSSFNEQPWRFILVKRGTKEFDKFLSFLFETNKVWAKHASHLVLILSKKTLTLNGKENKAHAFDTGASWENLALQATKDGINVRAMGGFDKELTRESLEISSDYEVQIMVAIGKKGKGEELPEEFKEKEKKLSERKELEELYSEGKFKW